MYYCEQYVVSQQKCLSIFAVCFRVPYLFLKTDIEDIELIQ